MIEEVCMDFACDRVVRLCHGAGNGVNTACWMMAVSMYAGRAANWNDQPECVGETIRAACIRLNDAMTDDERSRLIGPVLFLPVGTGPETEDVARERGYIAADYAVRVFFPIRARASKWKGAEDAARRAESLPQIEDAESARAAHIALTDIRAAITVFADAAYAAAYDAAYAAARAARAAAHAAACDAADAAADAALARTAREAVLVKAVEMIERMCAVGRDPQLTVDRVRASEVCKALSA